MKYRTPVFCLISAVAFSTLFTSCSESPSGNDQPVVKQTLTSEESADLRKMANTITAVVSFNDVYSADDMMAKKRSDVIVDDCEEVSPALTVCSYSYDNITSLDSTWSWSDAAKTVPGDMESVGPGKYIYNVVHTIGTDEKTKTDLYIDMSMKIPDYTALFSSEIDLENIDYTEFYKALEMSAKLSGSINYYNDDLLLEFYDVGYSLKDGSMSGHYYFKIMEGKYNVKVSFSMDYVKLMNDVSAEVQTDEVFRGAVTNSDGEQIGIFVLYANESVEIFDNNGNSLKTAG